MISDLTKILHALDENEAEEDPEPVWVNAKFLRLALPPKMTLPGFIRIFELTCQKHIIETRTYYLLKKKQQIFPPL